MMMMMMMRVELSLQQHCQSTFRPDRLNLLTYAEIAVLSNFIAAAEQYNQSACTDE